MAWTGDRRYLTQPRREGTWYVVVEVPRPLQAAVGQKRLLRSLKTSDLSAAQTLRWKVVAALREEIDAKTAPKIEQDARQALVAEALEVRQELREAPSSFVREMTKAGLSDRLDRLREAAPADAAVYADIVAGRADPLDTHLDRYLTTRKAAKDFAQRSEADCRTAMGDLATWLKEAKYPLTVQSVTSRVAGEFRDLGMVAKGMNPRTINKKLSLLSGFWKWMIKVGILDHDTLNPWGGKQLPRTREWRDNQEVDATGLSKGSGPRPYTEDEIATLVYGPAPRDLHDLMWIGALSGMRLEEIGQLRVRDCAGGLFDIRRSKTKAGVRKVPIHSALADIIRERTTDAKTSEALPADAFIFPDFPDSGWDGARTMAVSKRFATYRRRLGVDDKPDPDARRSRVDFHSFRRWFARKCEETGQHESVVARVMGHSEGLSITFGLYSQAQPIDIMRACVESVNLPNRPPIDGA